MILQIAVTVIAFHHAVDQSVDHPKKPGDWSDGKHGRSAN
jgi:hypothetical protein